jgi:hypothetical protein
MASPKAPLARRAAVLVRLPHRFALSVCRALRAESAAILDVPSAECAPSTRLAGLAELPGLRRLLFGHGDPVADDARGALQQLARQPAS